MKKRSVLLLFGGISTEHEISCISASSVLSHLDPDRYDVTVVGITREGRWLLCTADAQAMHDDAWERAEGVCPAFLLPDAELHSLLLLREDGSHELRPVDVVFPVLHGIGGEDGTVQGLCRLAGIPCVGSGVASSALCMDKAFAKSVAAQAGLSQAHWLVVAPEDGREPEDIVGLVEDRFAYPVYVKPANAGSSVGISRAKNREELLAAIPEARAVDPKIVIEENIVGQEVEVAVIGNLAPEASTVGEIVAEGGFYSYSGKYLDNTSGTLIPARLSEKTAECVRREAVRAYKALGCRGFARADFFVTAEEKVIFNEINTIPGFTDISMYPKLMEFDGTDGDALVDRLIALALEQEESNG